MDLMKLFGRGRRPWSKAVGADLREAGEWLNRRNLANASDWALGEERTFEVNQEEGRMTLFFGDGKRALLPIQIIASFLPADRSVRWAWANDSVAPELAAAATELRRYGEAHAVAALTRPEQSLPFEHIVQYAALAASRFGCIGLYRCLREDHSTVFVGFGPPDLVSKQGESLGLDALWPKGRASGEFQDAARALVEAWDAEMFPIDRAFYQRADRSDDEAEKAMDAALDAKRAVYRRYWAPKNEDWRPESFAWPSEHGPAAFMPALTLPRRSGGCFVVRRPLPHRDLVYVVEACDGNLRITDMDADWGRGLVWGEPED